MAIIPGPPAPTHDLGPTRFTSLATPSRGSAETSVWSVEIDPGAPATPHSLTREEVFVVLDGTLTIDLGEPPERHVLEKGSAVVVEPGTILQLRNASDEELMLFIYGAPPVSGGADFFDDVP